MTQLKCSTCGNPEMSACVTCSGRDGWPNWRPIIGESPFESGQNGGVDIYVQEERRMDVIGQNGNDGLHYSETDAVLKVSAPALLHRAASIMEDRAKEYDRPEGERSMGRCVAAFNAITGRDLSEPEGWLLLQVLKDVRQWQRPDYHADSAEDCIAYAALKAEALSSAGRGMK